MFNIFETNQVFIIISYDNGLRSSAIISPTKNPAIPPPSNDPPVALSSPFTIYPTPTQNEQNPAIAKISPTHCPTFIYFYYIIINNI